MNNFDNIVSLEIVIGNSYMNHRKILKRFLDCNFIGYLDMRTVSCDLLGHCYLSDFGIANSGPNVMFGVYLCFEI